VRYSRTSRQTPVWVTAQAVMALARKPLPLKPVKRASASTQAAPAATATPAGGATTAPRARKVPDTDLAPKARQGAGKAAARPRARKVSDTLLAAVTPQQLLARAVVVPADAHRVGYVAGLAAFAVL
jgi:hypothetical protein